MNQSNANSEIQTTRERRHFVSFVIEFLIPPRRPLFKKLITPVLFVSAAAVGVTQILLSVTGS